MQRGNNGMAVTQELSMVRGDTFAFDIVLSDLDGTSISSIFFTAKKKATDATPIFQKSLEDGISLLEEGRYRVRVAPMDTDGVAAGKYVYDLQVGIGNDVYTILIGTLQIIQDVTTD